MAKFLLIENRQRGFDFINTDHITHVWATTPTTFADIKLDTGTYIETMIPFNKLVGKIIIGGDGKHENR